MRLKSCTLAYAVFLLVKQWNNNLHDSGSFVIAFLTPSSATGGARALDATKKRFAS